MGVPFLLSPFGGFRLHAQIDFLKKQNGRLEDENRKLKSQQKNGEDKENRTNQMKPSQIAEYKSLARQEWNDFNRFVVGFHSASR